MRTIGSIVSLLPMRNGRQNVSMLCSFVCEYAGDDLTRLSGCERRILPFKGMNHRAVAPTSRKKATEG